jgi:hypothetical protein
MEEKSKANPGLRRSSSSFSLRERDEIIQDLLSSECTRAEIWRKYTGQSEEHGYLLRWMQQLGYPPELQVRRHIFVRNNDSMAKKAITTEMQEESFEILQLKKRINELENQLKDAEMKAIAYSTMVDIAEKEFKIPIRKKLNTKPLKK